MTTPRALVKDALTDQLDPASVTVLAYARQIAPPPRPTVMVRLDRAIPGTLAGVGLVRSTGLALIVLAAKPDPPGPADDELDALLEDVLHAVEQAPGLTWTEAKRAVYADSIPAYEVSVTTHTTHTTPEEP